MVWLNNLAMEAYSIGLRDPSLAPGMRGLLATYEEKLPKFWCGRSSKKRFLFNKSMRLNTPSLFGVQPVGAQLNFDVISHRIESTFASLRPISIAASAAKIGMTRREP